MDLGPILWLVMVVALAWIVVRLFKGDGDAHAPVAPPDDDDLVDDMVLHDEVNPANDDDVGGARGAS
jgi:hypothetical protein